MPQTLPLENSAVLRSGKRKNFQNRFVSTTHRIFCFQKSHRNREKKTILSPVHSKKNLNTAPCYAIRDANLDVQGKSAKNGGSSLLNQIGIEGTCTPENGGMPLPTGHNFLL